MRLLEWGGNIMSPGTSSEIICNCPDRWLHISRHSARLKIELEDKRQEVVEFKRRIEDKTHVAEPPYKGLRYFDQAKDNMLFKISSRKGVDHGGQKMGAGPSR